MHDQLARASIGRAGEYLALSRISRYGHKCNLIHGSVDDAYIKTIDGLILTLQIKTASAPPAGRRSYSFHTKTIKNHKRSDVWAFVVLDFENIFFCRGDSPIIQKFQTRLKPAMFLNEKTSMKEVFNSFS